MICDHFSAVKGGGLSKDLNQIIETLMVVKAKVIGAHTTFLKSFTKVTPFSNKGPILHWNSLSFHLSHQPPLSVMCHFLCSESDTFLPKSDIFTT